MTKARRTHPCEAAILDAAVSFSQINQREVKKH
jgi:hypothetical protein